MQHTPGPLKFHPETGQIAGTRPLAVCKVWRTGNETQYEGNGYLFAAAPELLAALKRVWADWQAVPEDVQVPDEINDGATWLLVEMAIAKAEGR